MRVRTAKKLAERIDLYYFTRSRGLRRWRVLLSIALPAAVLLWVGASAATGSRTAYSAGPVSSAHVFTENKCEACHASPGSVFRVHTTEQTCLSCHAAPAHAANQPAPPACAECHQEHRGRIQLVKTDDRFCVACHDARHAPARVAAVTRRFPDGHPEFAAVRGDAPADPARVKFNHAVHLKDGLRGPKGPETLQCAACHQPETAPARPGAKRPPASGPMTPVSYQQQCARCHPLFFDERIEQTAPHETPERVRGFVRQALAGYIRDNPGDISKPDSAFRRVPLNVPRPPEPPARNAAEWVARRAAADERILWNKTCAECHDFVSTGELPVYAKTNIAARWMPRAAFTHEPHRMTACATCHQAAQTSTKTSDVLLPKQAVCATCHAPAKAQSGCFECHRYHDWTKSRP